MHKMKKTVALTMAATMILASSVTAFADETSGSSTGAGTSEGHMNTHVIHVTLPTVDAGVTPFAYTMDPERLIQQTTGEKYATGTTFPAEASDTGVYFLTGSGTGTTTYEEVETSDEDDFDTYYVAQTTAATYKATEDTAIDSEKTYYTESGGVYTAVTSSDAEDIGDYYEVDVPASTSYVKATGTYDDGTTYYTAKTTAGAATYANSSSVLTATSESSADVKLTVSVAASEASTDISLVDSAPAADEDEAKLYLGLVVSDGTNSTTTAIKAGETVSKEVTIAGKDSNFEASVVNGAYEYVAKDDASITWNSASFNLTGAVSNVSAENLTAPTLTVTWKYEDPATGVGETDVAPSIATKSYTYDKSADLEIEVKLGNGEKAATKVAKVYRYAGDTDSAATELASGSKWSYEDGTLTFKSGQFGSNTSGDKRYIQVVFDDDDNTAVNIELVVK